MPKSNGICFFYFQIQTFYFQRLGRTLLNSDERNVIDAKEDWYTYTSYFYYGRLKRTL